MAGQPFYTCPTHSSPAQHNAFYQKLISDREKTYSDRAKAKSKYDESCHELESQRAKLEKDKHADRAKKSVQAAEEEMCNAKVSARTGERWHGGVLALTIDSARHAIPPLRTSTSSPFPHPIELSLASTTKTYRVSRTICNHCSHSQISV